jgi:6-phosphogluconate dehydrogenase
MAEKADIGVIGLGVMGANLSLNLADKGSTVVVHNRTQSVTDVFMAGEAADKKIRAADSVESLVAALAKPRIVLLMVKAGEPVDLLIAQLSDSLEEGDVIIDGGNSLYQDTERRRALVEERGMLYLGLGISGGEEGARHGPSLMPGGSPGAWERTGRILKGIAARAPDGAPCCEWLGEGGAGHFVKMVHNGIEYGDMQLIAEAYDLMRRGLGMSAAAIGETFSSWNEGRLRSYLIEITADILHETEDGTPLVDLILDAAGQKGTGKWTVIASMDLAEPTSLVAEAVYARIVSSDPDARRRSAAVFSEEVTPLRGIEPDDIETALYASKIISYAQGFRLMRSASIGHGWDLDLATIASIWRAGCIIRADFLEDITRAYRNDPGLADLAEDGFFAEALTGASEAWRKVVAAAAGAGIPVPAYSSALSYFDSMRSEGLPANLIQAQRDYFGAHTFERVDRPRGEFFHHDWGSG